jgi:hypothetical protein
MVCGVTLFSFCAVLKATDYILSIILLKLETQCLQRGVQFRNISNTVHINQVQRPKNKIAVIKRTCLHLHVKLFGQDSNYISFLYFASKLKIFKLGATTNRYIEAQSKENKASFFFSC